MKITMKAFLKACERFEKAFTQKKDSEEAALSKTRVTSSTKKKVKQRSGNDDRPEQAIPRVGDPELTTIPESNLALHTVYELPLEDYDSTKKDMEAAELSGKVAPGVVTTPLDVKQSILLAATTNWNFIRPSTTCCHFHSVLYEANEVIASLNARSCNRNWQPVPKMICQTCGLIEESSVDDNCDFCEKPLCTYSEIRKQLVLRL